MLEINLLPKEYQKRKFQVTLEKNTLYIIGSGIAVLLLLAVYSFFFQVMPISSLENKIVKAREQTKEYDVEISLIKQLTEEKKLLLSRISTIDTLDANRESLIKVVSDLGARIPSYLWLTSFEQTVVEGGETGQGSMQVSIEGKTFSINSLATFLVRLKKSSYLNNIDLSMVELIEERLESVTGDLAGAETYESYNFTINANLLLNGKSIIKDDNTLIASKQTAGSEF